MRATDILQKTVDFINESLEIVKGLGDTWVVAANVKDVGAFTKPVVLASGTFKEMYDAHNIFKQITNPEEAKAIRLLTMREFKAGH